MTSATLASRRGADSLSDEIAALRRRLDKVERRGPQLAYSSVEGGAITWNDDDGTTTMVVGAQPDGTNAPTVITGPTPPGATGVSAENGVNSIIVAWFGTFMEDVPAPLDYARAEFHISDIGPEFEPDVVGLGDPSTTLLATLESPRGGKAIVSGLPYTEHWVKVVIRSLSGKFSVESEAVSITPRQVDTEDIAFGAVKAESLDAGAVTAEKLDVQVLQAGFTVTGKLQIGASYWTPTELVFPQPDGTFTRFSADGSGTNEISGNIRAKSLTIQNDLNLLGTRNKVSGTLGLTNGVTAPTVPPTISTTWPNVGWTSDSIAGVYWGACERIGAPNEVMRTVSFFGGSIQVFRKDTGENWTWTQDTSGVAAWGGDAGAGTQFFPTGGIVATATHYFVLGQDQARAMGWYVYKLQASNLAKVGEYYWGTSSFVTGRPTIGFDGTYLLAGMPQGSGVYFSRINPTTMAGVGADDSIPIPEMSAANSLYHLSYGTYDWPDGVARWVIGAVGLGTLTYNTVAGTAREGDLYRWRAPFNEELRGLWYSAGKWQTVSSQARISTLSDTYKTATTINAAYTWYDGVGTTRETQSSPVATYALEARAQPFVQTGTPPDSGNTDPAQVDKANRVGLYASRGVLGSNPVRLQSYLTANPTTGVSVQTSLLSNITAAGATAPGSNGFIGGASSPGAIQSDKTDGGGSIILLQGSGAGRAGPLKWDVDGKVTAGSMGAYSNWTPTLTNMNKGSTGTVTAWYTRIGDFVHFEISIGLLGTGVSVGTAPSFTLPFPMQGGGSYSRNIHVVLYDASDVPWEGVGYLGGTDRIILAYKHANVSGGAAGDAAWFTDVTASKPFPWIAGDSMHISGDYRAQPL